MGWSSGSDLAGDMISAIKQYVKDDKIKTKLYEKLIDAFENHDCDTLYECVGMDKTYDAVYKELYPDEESDFD